MLQRENPLLPHRILQKGSCSSIHFVFAYCISLPLRAKALNGWWGLLFWQSTTLKNHCTGNSCLTASVITWKYRNLKITLFSTVSKTHFRAAIWIPATLSLKKKGMPVLVILSKMNLHPWIVNCTSLMVNDLIKSDTDDLKTNLALSCILFSVWFMSNTKPMVKSYSSINSCSILKWSTVAWFAQWKLNRSNLFWHKMCIAGQLTRVKGAIMLHYIAGEMCSTSWTTEVY